MRPYLRACVRFRWQHAHTMSHLATSNIIVAGDLSTMFPTLHDELVKFINVGRLAAPK